MQRTAIVTGAASGIGRGLAEGFAEAGYRVLGIDLQAVGEPVAGVEPVMLDVTDADAVARFGEGLETLDAVVNAAGVIRRMEEFDPEVFQRVVDINLNGVMRVCAACRPALARGGGAIVNIASMLSFFGGPLVPAYSASKGGIVTLTKSLAAAWAGEGIRVNALAPGWIATPLTQALQDDPARSRPILERTPMGRWGTPGDLVGPALFLTSPAAAFVTGVVLPVDGGYSSV